MLEFTNSFCFWNKNRKDENYEELSNIWIIFLRSPVLKTNQKTLAFNNDRSRPLLQDWVKHWETMSCEHGVHDKILKVVHEEQFESFLIKMVKIFDIIEDFLHSP
jgi:hypothetical protein